MITEKFLYKIKSDEIIIPYTLKQKYSGSTKELKLKLILSANNNYNFFDLLKRCKKKRTKTELTIYPKGSFVESEKKDYFGRLHNKEFETKTTFLRPLLINIEGEIIFAPTIVHLSENFSTFIENIAVETSQSFYWKYSLLGYTSYLPETFTLQEPTGSEEQIYHFCDLFSPLSQNSFCYNAAEEEQIKSKFFFDKEELNMQGIKEREINTVEIFLEKMNEILEQQTNDDERIALKIAITKLSESIDHISLYNKFFPSKGKIVGAGAKQTSISRYLEKAEKLCRKHVSGFPKGHSWKAYHKNPSEYIKDTIKFK